MKKIFAIALALVMVLSMASAFASYCTAGFDWTCATTEYNCGKATVEVIPYVKTNAACNGSEFVESDCAAAINGENVYYAIKVTVAEDVDLEWWDKVKFELTVKGMTKNYDEKFKVAKPSVKMADDKSEDGWEFYYVIAGKNAGWHEATENDEFEIDKVMNKSVVKEFAKAKVCMTLTSVKDAKKGEFAGVVGDYFVVYTEGAGAVEAADAWVTATVKTSAYDQIAAHKDWTILAVVYDGAYSVVTAVPKAETPVKDKDYFANISLSNIVAFTKGGTAVTKGIEYDHEEQVVAEAGTETQLVVYTKDPAKGGKALVTYTIVDGKVRTIKNTPVCGEAEYATIKDFFGLEIGTCVDKDLIAANFGWDEKVKSCYEWKTQNATAIVDTECVVAIPKTGDASVLAWLF